MNTNKTFNCLYCDYTSNRKYNLNIHELNKHFKDILNETNVICTNNIDTANVSVSNKKYNFCSKCHKKYLTINSLKNHEKKCIGIDILTCIKCMKSFTSRQHKSDHIKRNNCKAKSIIYARQLINNNSNNAFINNYGNERLDYLSEDDMLNILASGNNMIPFYIEKKHFNKDFPENNNIQYDDKSKKCKIKENNKWKNMNLSMASSKLINDNSLALLTYFDTNKELLNKQIKNNEIYDFIIEKLLYIKNKSDKEQYNNLFNIIKFLIEGSNNLII